MDGFALSLVVCGALLHASWNLLAKKASGGAPFVWLAGAVSSLTALPCAYFAWLQQPIQFNLTISLAIVASALIHLLYALTLQTGYQRADFSVVYPLARGTGPLFSVLAAVLLLGEQAGWLGSLAIAAILAGILFLSDGWRIVLQLVSRPSPDELNANTRQRLRAGLVWGCLTGSAIAAYTVIDGWAIRQLGLPPLLYYALSLPLRTLLLAPSAWRRPELLRHQWHQHRHYIIAVGLLSPLAYLLALLALQRAPLVYIAPSRELSMLAGVVVAAYYLGERLSRTRLLGVFFMLAGVCLLAWR